MNAKVTWKNKLTFTGTADSGFTIPLGTSSDLGGDNDGFPPIELLTIGLAGCTAMDIISILQKKRQEIAGFEVQVHSERAEEHPKVITKATIEYYLCGKNVQEEAVIRAIELSATRYCPAHTMLGKAFPIEMIYFLFEGESFDNKVLVKRGEYKIPKYPEI